MIWPAAPLFAVAQISRNIVQPDQMPSHVLHFSIPALEETGAPVMEESDGISSAKQHLRGGEVLISRLNPRKARIVLVPPLHASDFAVASTEFVVASPGPRTEARFLAYFLLSPRVTEDLDSQVRSATRSHQRVDPEVITSLRIPLLPIEEQWRIADFLDEQTTRIDQIINARLGQKALLQDWATGKYQEVVFDSALPAVRLGAMADVRLGRQRSPLNESGEFMTRYLRSANVFDGRFVLYDVKEMNFEPSERRIFELRVGDVLVTEGAGSPDAVGASAVWEGRDEGLCFQNTLLRIRCRRGDVLPHYLGWWARTAHRSGGMRANAAGAGILHLGSEGLKRMVIPTRTRQEQQVIIDACRAVEAAEADLKQSFQVAVDLLQEFKRSLISAAVSGEFDVSSASGRGVPVR